MRFRRETQHVNNKPNINDHAFEFLEVSGGIGHGVFCPKHKIDSIKLIMRIFQFTKHKISTVNTAFILKAEGSGERRDTPYINIEIDVIVKSGVFEEVFQALDSGKGVKRVEIPQKYVELDEAAQPGTPIFGYDERELFAYSKDHMAFRHVYLVLLDGQVYVEHESGYHYITGYPLPDELNKYVIDTVFA
jgi:hypothetical protein